MRHLGALRLPGACLLVLYAGYQMWQERPELPPPAVFSVPLLAVSVLLQMTMPWLNLRLALADLKWRQISVQPLDLWRINLWGSLLNLLLPFGLGMVLRGVWLNRQHGLSASSASWHLIAINLLMILINLWWLLIVMALLTVREAPIMASACWGVALLAVGVARRHDWARTLSSAALMQYPLFLAIYLALDYGLGLNLPLLYLVLMPIVLNLASLVVLAPGSLGVTEALFVLVGGALAIAVAPTLWLSLAARAGSLLALAILLPLLHLPWISRITGKNDHER